MLPPNNELPTSTYEAKKILCPMGMNVKKIHACPNDCVLFQNEHEHLHTCPKCGASGYKREASNSSTSHKKRPPVKWRTIDGKFPEFGQEARNLRLGLCADGMNPYRTLSSQRSTWPVLLTINNLHETQPLIKDLKLLWDQGERVYDAYNQADFTMRAMIFCTISDFPGYGNLSGYSIKGANACPICEDATIDIRLKNCKKNVYMDHRTFLPLAHLYRKRKRSFDGTIETRVARLPLTGKEVFERVKNIDIVLGKLYKNPTTSSIWKKRSIFWDLPYWKHLQVRHCLDFMHIEKNVSESIIRTLLNIPGKTKDGVKARLDLQEMGVRTELTPQ
ncbi:hypothetical protein AgCh_000951 [Apium graveolens]